MISTLFFILAPFALFCSADGNGIVLCIAFLVVGAVAKLIETSGIKIPIKRTKNSEPDNWWEEQYKRLITSGNSHEVSVSNADFLTNANHRRMPTEDEKEAIARSMGVITDKMKCEEEDKWNRIQAEKYRLMEQLYKKYKNMEFRSDDYVYGKRQGRVACPDIYIKYSMLVLEGFIRKARYSKTDPWSATLSDEEKEIAKKWIEEYEERLIKEVNDYVYNGIQMPTITKHKDRGGWARHSEYDVKYGFCREGQF